MDHSDQINFVKKLPIQELEWAYPTSKGGDDTVEGVEQSFLNAKSIVSFVSDLSEQHRNDVLNSVLIAQLAANKKFPGETQVQDWYKSFVNVLNNLGWAIEAAEFSTFKASKDIFEVENAIIDILTAAFGGTFLTVITKTLASIKGLSDGNGKILAFENNTHSLSKGAFQIGLAKEVNGSVSLQIGTFLLTSSNEIKQILFFKSTKDQTKLEYCSRQGTLNDEIYAKIREAVIDKLGVKSKDFISEIDI
jgi:hypothetical protein